MSEPAPEISIIVPVYKVEAYLRRCLDSLLHQNFRNYEVIVVDDGSPDGCGVICDEYAGKDPRFRVFHKENGGLSSARNYGIEKARGKYFMFVDSDDWVEPDFCRIPYSIAKKKDADLVIFNFYLEGGRRRLLSQKETEIPGLKTLEEAFELILGRVGHYAWNKLYKRELFADIRYPEGRLFEDIGTTYRTFRRAGIFFYTRRKLYHYVLRKGSIVHSSTHHSMHDMYQMSRKMHRDILYTGFPKRKLKKSVINRAMSYCITVGEDRNDADSRHAVRVLRSIHGIPSFLTWKRKILLILFRIHPFLFDLCCILWKRRIKPDSH